MVLGGTLGAGAVELRSGWAHPCARAASTSPQLLLADEPTSQLSHEDLTTPALVATLDWTRLALLAALTVRGARGSTLRENAR